MNDIHKIVIAGITIGLVGWIILSSGCETPAGRSFNDATTYRQEFGWKAKDYFQDSRIIACCKAIDARDLAELDRLLSSGVDVNTLGKANMSLLLWSMPVPESDDTKLFQALLTKGADPNVKFNGEFGSRQRLRPEDSVTTLAAKSRVETLRLVLKHQGDVSQTDSSEKPLLNIALHHGGVQIKERVQLLIDNGIDLDRYCYGQTPAMYAVSRGFYDIALMLCKAGAKHELFEEKSCQRLIHVLIRVSQRLGKQLPGYEDLLTYLVDQGEDIQEVQEDFKRWSNYSEHGATPLNMELERRMMKERYQQKLKQRSTNAKANVDMEGHSE